MLSRNVGKKLPLLAA